MSLILVKDNANSKIRELECDSNGLLKVDKVDVSSLATQATLSSLNGKVTAVNTGAVVVSSSALPTGGATSALQTTGNTTLSTMNGKITACDTSALATDATLSTLNGKVTACDTSALATQATLSTLNGKVTACDTSALATQATLSALNGKVTACDTGSISGTVAVSAVSGDVACTHASLPLPSGASTSANQVTGNTSLATLAGCVSANKVAVTSVPATPSSTHLYMWGDASAGESVSNGSDQFSDSVDVGGYNKIAVFGSSSNLSDEFEFQVSHNDSNWFELTSVFVQVDYSSGEFGFVVDAPFEYVRLKKKGTGGSGSDTVWAIVSAK